MNRKYKFRVQLQFLSSTPQNDPTRMMKIHDPSECIITVMYVTYYNLHKISQASSFAKSRCVGSLLLESMPAYLYVVSANRKALE